MDAWQIIISLTIIAFVARAAFVRKKDAIFAEIERRNLAGVKKAIQLHPGLINKFHSWHGSPLHFALRLKQGDIAAFLLENGAQINAKDKNGSSPLHTAALFSNPGLLMKLIQKGADLNACDKDGDSPLHSAVIGEKMDNTAALIDAGANVNVRNLRGLTAVMYAVMFEKDATARLLFKNGATFSDIDITKLKVEMLSQKPYSKLKLNGDQLESAIKEAVGTARDAVKAGDPENSATNEK